MPRAPAGVDQGLMDEYAFKTNIYEANINSQNDAEVGTGVEVGAARAGQLCNHLFLAGSACSDKRKHRCAAPPEPTQYIVGLPPPAVQKTNWLGTIWPGSRIYNHFATGLAFLHLGGDNTQAYVGICRYGGNENLNSCCNDADNDCNGLVSCSGQI